MRTLWDFAWQYPALEQLLAYEADAASYTGAARADIAYYDSLRTHGIGVLMIQETVSTRSQEGYNAGVYDAQYARRRSREVGHPDSAPIAYAVSDGSRYDPNYGAENVANYGEAVTDTEVGPFKFYGNRYCVDAACAGAARSANAHLCLNLNGGWLPRTWGFDANRDTAAQEIGGAPVAGIDVNTVYRPIFDAPAPAPAPQPTPTPTERPEMFVGLKERPGGAPNDFDAAWVDGGVVIRWFQGTLTPLGYLAVPGDAIVFEARRSCGFEVLTAGEWDPIELRTVATQK